jgi:NTP pyrophosphatase (non-canonical NTP hydrolase)
MDIRQFQDLCAERNRSYTPNWLLAQWGNALAGEVGECCNVVKKIERGTLTMAEGVTLLATEVGDVLAYLALLSDAAGIDLERATITKFNEVSERINSPVRAP